MERREFLALVAGAALVGCERPQKAPSGPGYSVTLCDLKTGQEVGKKATGPTPALKSYGFEQSAFGFILAGGLIEADSARAHPIDGLYTFVWHQKDACIAYNNEETSFFDLNQDKLVWTNNDHVATGRRVVDGGMVLVPHRGGMAALDLSTGKTVWNENGLGNPGFMLARAGQAVVAPYHLNRVNSYDLKTGKPTNSIELPDRNAIPRVAIPAGDVLVVGCPRIGIFAYRGDKLLWRVKISQEEDYPTLPGADSSVVLLNSDNVVRALATTTGKEMWAGPNLLGDGHALKAGILIDRKQKLSGQTEVDLQACDALTGKKLWTRKVRPEQLLSVDDKRVALLDPA